MSDADVERVARAIAIADSPELLGADWEDWAKEARAAIAAMPPLTSGSIRDMFKDARSVDLDAVYQRGFQAGLAETDLSDIEAAYLRGWQERGKRDAEIAAAQDWAMGTASTVAHVIVSAIRALATPETKP